MKKAIKSRIQGLRDLDARRSVRSTARDVRKGARSRYVRARVAAARATASRRTRTDKKKVAVAGAAGAAGAYFLDPQVGPRRRYAVRDKVLSLAEGLKGKARSENDAISDQARATEAEVSAQ